MKILLILFLTITLSSCEVEEVLRQPILASPLGLIVKTAPISGGGTGFGISFTANNPENFFSGFAIFISTRREDFQQISDTNVFFPVVPTEVAGSQAVLLTNYTVVNNKNVSIWLGAQMSLPERQYYPPVGIGLILDPNAPDEDPVFTSSSFADLPNGNSFVSGTIYYFAAYSYSSLDNSYSLPSNIATVTFP